MVPCSWWTSPRSSGRRRRHQVAAIGLQLAGAGIERGGRWPRPGCRRSARSWRTSTRSRGRRRRHQVAAIGLQLAGAGIERQPLAMNKVVGSRYSSGRINVKIDPGAAIHSVFI
jgi:hypothetical protein